MAIQFRINASRMGFVKDSTCNFAMRTYFMKSDAFMAAQTTRNKEDLIDSVAPFICSMYFGLNLCTQNNLDIQDIKRIQIFYNDDENYFSIIIGFKLSTLAKNDIENASLRYYIAVCSHYFDVSAIYTNAYETHLKTGYWDTMHCNLAPYIDYRLKEASDLFSNSLTTCREIYKEVDGCLKRDFEGIDPKADGVKPNADIDADGEVVKPEGDADNAKPEGDGGGDNRRRGRRNASEGGSK